MDRSILWWISDKFRNVNIVRVFVFIYRRQCFACGSGGFKGVNVSVCRVNMGCRWIIVGVLFTET
jgi:hypothetical protein